MPRDTVALPPLLLPAPLHERLEAQRARMQAGFSALLFSRTSVFVEAVSVGLRDLATELAESTSPTTNGSATSYVAEDRGSTTFFAPSPPRGSRWVAQDVVHGTPAKGSRGKQSRSSSAPSGFVRLTTMVVSRDFLASIDAVRRAFDKVRPGLVASRAMLIREALSRGLAAFQQQQELHDRLMRMSMDASSPFPPSIATIPLEAILPPAARSTSRSRAKARPKSRTTKRTRARRAKRSGAKSRDPDDGEPSTRRICRTATLIGGSA